MDVETWKIVVSSNGAYSYTVMGDRPRMTTPAKAEVKFSPDQTYEAKIKRITEGDQEAARQIGAYLFSFLFKGAMGKAFSEWYSYVTEKGCILRLLLSLDEELADQPWEYLFSQDLQFLGLNKDFSLVRCLGNNSNMQRPPISLADTSALILDSNPPEGDVNGHLKTDLEVQAISQFFPHARVIRDEQSSLKSLRRILAENKSGYHILHFIGHSGEGQFLFRSSSAANRVALGNGNDIAIVLQEHRSLRVLVFTSCASSELILPLVHLQGVPAIVAMQHDIDDTFAEEFSRIFYENLTLGMPLDLAIFQARIAVFLYFDARKTQWGYPTLSVASANALDCFLPVTQIAPDKKSEEGPKIRQTSHKRKEQEQQQKKEENKPKERGEQSRESPLAAEIVTEGTKPIKAHQSQVSALAFVGNRNILISGAKDGTLKAWQCNRLGLETDEAASQIRGNWFGHTKDVISILSMQHADGSEVVLSASLDSSLRAWNWAKGESLGKYYLTSTAINAMAASPTDNALAFATLSGKLFYLPDPFTLFTFPELQNISTLAHEREIKGVGSKMAFSEDGKRLGVASTRPSLQIWSWDSDKQVLSKTSTLLWHDEGVQSVVAISHDRFITGTVSGKLCLWDASQETSLQTISSQSQDPIKWLAWIKNHNLLLAVSPTLVSLMAVQNTIATAALWSWKAELGEITSVAIARDGALIAVGLTSGAIYLFYLRT